MRELFIKYFGRFLALLGCSTMVAACYGTPMDMDTTWVEGRVRDAETGAPVNGIRVSVIPGLSHGENPEDMEVIGREAVVVSSSDGIVQAYVEICQDPDVFQIRCIDVDGSENGSYEPLNEFVTSENARDFELKLIPAEE